MPINKIKKINVHFMQGMLRSTSAEDINESERLMLSSVND